VIGVADALFIEKGYGATSMATVALRARVGKQTLYRRFPDKAALFREVIRRRIDSLVAGPDDGVIDGDPLAELKSLGGAALNAVLDAEFIRLFRIVIAEAEPFPELACAAADNFGSSFIDRCRNAIERAQAMTRCKAGDPEKLAKCFIWSLVGDPFHKALSGQSVLTRQAERDDQLELVWAVFVAGITV
jgi:AcrR family transcriptional regulator